jgi:hypothetical protein
MTTHEATVAWRLFELNWIPLLGICTVLAFSLLLTDFSIEPLSASVLFGIVIIYAGFAYYNAKAPHRGNPTVVFMLGSIAQANLVAGVMALLTYVAAATALPLQDANLYAIDQALGLDWRGYLSFVNDHPVVSALLAKSYALIGLQIFVVPLVLAGVRQFGRLQQYILALTLTLIATTVISIIVPALGVYYHLGLTAADHPNVTPGSYLDCLRDLPLVRDGSLRHLDLFALAGLVTFPSFHAASAILYGWALWPLRWVGPFTLIVNSIMLASTPIGGGHYFIDVIAGIVITLLAIAAARLVSVAVIDRARLKLAAATV